MRSPTEGLVSSCTKLFAEIVCEALSESFLTSALVSAKEDPDLVRAET